MCAIDMVKTIVDKTSSLVSYVRTTGLGVDCKPQLVRHIEARWHTVYDMLKSVSLNYATLSKILLAKEEADRRSDVLGKLTCLSRTELDAICDFLAKFKIWIKQLESDKTPTLWMVWPTFINLRKYLQVSNDDSDIVRAMKAKGREYLENNLADFEPKLIHKIGTVLHPILKNIAIAPFEEREMVYTSIDEELQKIVTSDTEESKAAQKKNTVNQDIIDEFMGRSSGGGSLSQMDIESHSDELQRYLSANIPIEDPFNFNLYDWWFKNRHTYKHLFRLFLIKAGVCASSTQSERSFSTTGIILEARRSCLLPETVQNLMLARNKYLNYQ